MGVEAEKSPVIVPSDPFPTHNGEGAFTKASGWRRKTLEIKRGGRSQARKGFGPGRGGGKPQVGRLPRESRVGSHTSQDDSCSLSSCCVPGLLQHFACIIWFTEGETEAYRH